MKETHIFHASQTAATPTLRSMEEPPSSSSSILHGGGSRSPAIDRCNPIITDSRRATKPLPPRTTTAAAKPPVPHKTRHKKKNHRIPPKEHGENDKESNSSSTDIGSAVRKGLSCTKPGDFISPPGSTRYLLSEKVMLDPALSLFPAEASVSEPPDSVDAGPPSSDQVVVLRVSLHCRGCEKKMRKHISRMEGVRSFSIDFAAKKVTVMGDVTPVEVLSSISKVKNAQLLPPAISSSPARLSRNHGDGHTASAWLMDEGAFLGIPS